MSESKHSLMKPVPCANLPRGRHLTHTTNHGVCAPSWALSCDCCVSCVTGGGGRGGNEELGLISEGLCRRERWYGLNVMLFQNLKIKNDFSSHLNTLTLVYSVLRIKMYKNDSNVLG